MLVQFHPHNPPSPEGETMSKIIKLTVIGKARTLTMAERVAAAKLSRGAAVTELVWPRQTPYYGDDKQVRRAYYFDALAAADSMADKIATAIARGYAVHVTVESGAVMAGTVVPGDKQASTYANVIAPDLLSQICAMADNVDIAAGAEDPRDYVAD